MSFIRLLMTWQGSGMLRIHLNDACIIARVLCVLPVSSEHIELNNSGPTSRIT